MAKSILFRPCNSSISDSDNRGTDSFAPSDEISDGLASEDYWQVAITLVEDWKEYRKTSILYQKVTNDATRSVVWPTVAKHYDGKPSLIRQREYRLSKKFDVLLEVFGSICKGYHVKPVQKDFFLMQMRELRDCNYYLNIYKEKKKSGASASALDAAVLK